MASTLTLPALLALSALLALPVLLALPALFVLLALCHAEVAKLADAPDLGSGGAILRGSSPLLGKYLAKNHLCCRITFGAGGFLQSSHVKITLFLPNLLKPVQFQ